MKIPKVIFKLLFFVCILSGTRLLAQKVDSPVIYNPNRGGPNGELEISTTIKKVKQIQRIFLISKTQTIDLITEITSPVSMSAKPNLPLLCALKKQGAEVNKTSGVSCRLPIAAGEALILEDYKLFIVYLNDKGSATIAETIEVVLENAYETLNNTKDTQADTIEDADYYVSGNITGAHKKKTAFTTEMKLQPYKSYYSDGSLILTPVYFKLNTSTAPDADPDKMEIGFKFRKVIGRFASFRGGYFDNGAKVESEKDFDNTNLIYDTRFIFLPPAFPKKSKKVKVFVNPFIGAELGKNLRSPVNTAEGDGIGRVLGGANVRFAFLKDGKPWANWTTSYTRRWLLSNELGYNTDDDDNLVLTQFGKSPRDYFESKFSFKLKSFTDAFIAYDWGEVPPSYKKIDHRFRLGFEFKRKTVVE